MPEHTTQAMHQAMQLDQLLQTARPRTYKAVYTVRIQDISLPLPHKMEMRTCMTLPLSNPEQNKISVKIFEQVYGCRVAYCRSGTTSWFFCWQ